jgi:hypothetical protein
VREYKWAQSITLETDVTKASPTMGAVIKHLKSFAMSSPVSVPVSGWRAGFYTIGAHKERQEVALVTRGDHFYVQIDNPDYKHEGKLAPFILDLDEAANTWQLVGHDHTAHDSEKSVVKSVVARGSW